ncbi:hypothetical protein CIG75_09555 [Tumebacillus algifaecis]|uniref:Uncharacterized protein n=1 Tax=Tumebacillus algifaecis TaxID=1214604 RepID=A0A223D0R1_9BACL|nr:hypothetical protein [Tumebacillus algifaecis]ASS75202.1 hypothetical protein CIG75_09555 [Tumebacillus algifaecis]
MRNFAEELAYWYFRLNGFFLIENYVLHRQGHEMPYNADIDLLGVRHKYSYEAVERRQFDPDPNLMRHFQPNKHIGILCEVKSGNATPANINLSKKERLLSAVERIGFFSRDKSDAIASDLVHKKTSAGTYHQVGKILLTKDGIQRDDFICLKLLDVEQFLIAHLQKNLREKAGGKLFFPAGLIQYLMWKVEEGLG